MKYYFYNPFYYYHQNISSKFIDVKCPLQPTPGKFNEAGQSFNFNPASLKRKTPNSLGTLSKTHQLIKNISNELNNHKKEVQALRSEKETLECAYNEDSWCEIFKRQKSRIQQQITALKG